MVDGDWVWGERPVQVQHHSCKTCGMQTDSMFNGSSDKLPKPKAFVSRVILRKGDKS
jgi:hypothetical protein